MNRKYIDYLLYGVNKFKKGIQFYNHPFWGVNSNNYQDEAIRELAKRELIKRKNKRDEYEKKIKYEKPLQEYIDEGMDPYLVNAISLVRGLNDIVNKFY